MTLLAQPTTTCGEWCASPSGSGVVRHKRRGEEPCAVALEAQRAYHERRRRAAGVAPAPVAQCGTRSGYAHHLRVGERPCDACRMAHNAALQANRQAKRERDRDYNEVVGDEVAYYLVSFTCRVCGSPMREQARSERLFDGREAKAVVRCVPCHRSYLLWVTLSPVAEGDE